MRVREGMRGRQGNGGGGQEGTDGAVWLIVGTGRLWWEGGKVWSVVGKDEPRLGTCRLLCLPLPQLVKAKLCQLASVPAVFSYKNQAELRNK